MRCEAFKGSNRGRRGFLDGGTDRLRFGIGLNVGDFVRRRLARANPDQAQAERQFRLVLGLVIGGMFARRIVSRGSSQNLFQILR
jgi:hypothetical protein